MTARSLVRPLVRPLVRGVVRNVPGSAPYVATERITNGGFANGSGWSVSGVLIAGGVATFTVGNGTLTQNIGVTIAAGMAVELTFDFVNFDDLCIIFIFLLNGAAVETLPAEFAPGSSPWTLNHTPSAAWNEIRWRATGVGSVSSTIDNVSLIA